GVDERHVGQLDRAEADRHQERGEESELDRGNGGGVAQESGDDVAGAARGRLREGSAKGGPSRLREGCQEKHLVRWGEAGRSAVTVGAAHGQTCVEVQLGWLAKGWFLRRVVALIRVVGERPMAV